MAVNAIKRGAFDFIVSEYKPEYLLHAIEKAVKHNSLTKIVEESRSRTSRRRCEPRRKLPTH